MPIKLSFGGRGALWILGRGGICQFDFVWARGFSELVPPKEFSHLRKRSSKTIVFLHFPWKLLQVREPEKVAGTFWQSTFSLDNLLMFEIWSG